MKGEILTWKAKPDPATVPFGVAFTDHMFLMDYDSENGWHDARIVPFADLSLSPGAVVFHYGAEVFEGLKAYRTPGGAVQLFRPEENMKRMSQSAERLCLPMPDEACICGRCCLAQRQTSLCMTSIRQCS